MRCSITSVAVLILFVRAVTATTFEVGPGQAFARIEEALVKAAAGDTILVHARQGGAAYAKPAILVRTPKLTIRSADEKSMVKLDGTGFDYSGDGHIPRAIVQFDPGADGCLLEGFELTGAHNGWYNGAGVRINQANAVTVRRCKVHANDMGIMSNGALAQKTGAGQLIEACTITDNGSEKDPGQNHNLYLGGTSVTVRACEIARALTGHNLKSRAHFNWIECNFIHDSANRELDLVDEKGNTEAPGSDTVLLGNYIFKKSDMEGNKTVIHFGQDGTHDHNGTLFLVHNTIVTPYARPVVDLSAPGATANFINNLVSDNDAQPKGVLVAARNGAVLDKVVGQGNVLGEAFRALAPEGVRRGGMVAWDKIDLPWPDAKRFALREFIEVGRIEPRKEPAPGAGSAFYKK